MKKVFAITLSILLALALFTACSPDEKEEELQNSNGGEDENGLRQGSDNAAEDLDWDLLG